jgi:hypothetical protein
MVAKSGMLESEYGVESGPVQYLNPNRMRRTFM